MPSRFPIASLLTSAGIFSLLACAAGCSSSDIPIGDSSNDTDAASGGDAGVTGDTGDGGDHLDATTDGPTGLSPDGSTSVATTVITGLPTVPSLMASDGTTLYILDSQSLTVGSVPVTGATTVTSVYAKSVERTLLQADPTGVYVIGAADGAQALLHVAAAGGAPTVISDGTGTVTAGVVSGQSAYWAQVPVGQQGQDGFGTIKTAPLGGGASTTLGQFGDPLGATGTLAVGTTAVFYSGLPRPSVVVPLNGSSDAGAITFSSGNGGCSWFPSSPGSASAYCVAQTGGPVEAVHADGTTTTLATSYFPHDAVADGTYLYWSDTPAPGGVLMKVPLAGGTASIVANEAATAVAVDATAIYWATSTGTIRRLLK